MPSSISSSDFCTYGRLWARTWAVALLLTCIAVAATEGYLRRHGHRPNVPEDIALWALQREKLSNRNRKTIALVGASQLKSAIDTDWLRQELPEYEIRQLARGSSTSIPTFLDLASDKDFRGVVIVDTFPYRMRVDNFGPQKTYVQQYRSLSPAEKLNRSISVFFQKRLVILDVGRRTLNRGKWPKKRWVLNRANRSMDFYFFGFNPPQDVRERKISTRVRQHREKHAQRAKKRLAQEQIRLRKRFRKAIYAKNHAHKSGQKAWPNVERFWLSEALQLDKYVKKIHARGGHVVFLRMPLNGKHLVDEEAFYPKGRYWDQFAKRTSGLPIHFSDYESLSAFDCPDWVHLNHDDKRLFTMALLDILLEKGILEQRTKQMH